MGGSWSRRPSEPENGVPAAFAAAAGNGETPAKTRDTARSVPSPALALVVGNYCHDVIKMACGREVESLGGSVSYMTQVMDAMRIRCKVVSKVGFDFKYRGHISASYLPAELPAPARTTSFYADFAARGSNERILRLRHACESIKACEIGDDERFEIGVAAGVAGEIEAETLERMARVSRVLVADIQALVRGVDADGTVVLRHLSETPFQELVMAGHLAFLKASSCEQTYIGLQKVRTKCCVIVTEGASGCRVYLPDREFHVDAFPATEVDPTGAGDSFLAGLCAGLIRGLPLENAVRLGNFFGAACVSHIGVPSLQTLQELLEKCSKGGVLDLGFKPAKLDAIDVTDPQFMYGNNDKKSVEDGEIIVINGLHDSAGEHDRDEEESEKDYQSSTINSV